jgi:hypothetical protein
MRAPTRLLASLVDTLARRVGARSSLALVPVVMLALLGGCRPMDMPAEAPADYGYGGDYGGEGGPGGYGKMAETVARDGAYDYRSDIAGVPAMAPAGSSTGTTTIDAQLEASPQPKPSPDQPAPEPGERKVVYTAAMDVSVYEIPEALAFAERLPERYDGWVHSRVDNVITLRIPAPRLREAMAEIAALGIVLGKSLIAADVTAEYTDLESRILVLEQLEEQLISLLDQATTVEVALKIRQELERVRIELELARTRMRGLAELIRFSTLTITFAQRGPLTAEIGSNDPFPWVDQLGVESTEYR